MTPKIKVAWAIDPSNSSDEIDENCRLFFKSLSSQCEVEIYPVYVASTAHNIYSIYLEIEPVKDALPYAITETEEYLKSFTDLNLKDYEILRNNTGFRSHEVKIFSDHIQNLNFDFVLLGSHGRTGFKRWALGSFSGNYILQSLIPTFVINSQMKQNSDVSHALAPVEIDSSAKSFLVDILESKNLSFLKKVSLFHEVRSNSFDEEAWVPELYAPSHYDFRFFLEKAKERAEIVLSSLVEKISSRMTLHYVVSKERGELEGNIISEAHHLGAGLVILKTNSTATNAIFFGSLSRELIRTSDLPVLVYPLKYESGQMVVG